MNGQMNLSRGLNSQAIGLSPILLFFFLNSFYTYQSSFLVATIFGLGCILLFWGLLKDKIYQLMFIPSILTLFIYALFLFQENGLQLYRYSPLLIEWLIVGVLIGINLLKPLITKKCNQAKLSTIQRSHLNLTLFEYFHVSRITYKAYLVHLFLTIFYFIQPEANQTSKITHFILTVSPIIIGLLIIIYEQIRVYLIKQKLANEKWLPLVNKKGKVFGGMALSESLQAEDKFCHPMYRIAIVYRGMLYLTKEMASNTSIDLPLSNYVDFDENFDQSISKVWSQSAFKNISKPRLLVQYAFENESISRFVSLYAHVVKTEEEFTQINKHLKGKLWMKGQVEDNIGKGVFNELFEKEYRYLASTVLFAEECIEINRYQARKSV